jgi:hypothetical protein
MSQRLAEIRPSIFRMDVAVPYSHRTEGIKMIIPKKKKRAVDVLCICEIVYM